MTQSKLIFFEDINYYRIRFPGINWLFSSSFFIISCFLIRFNNGTKLVIILPNPTWNSLEWILDYFTFTLTFQFLFCVGCNLRSNQNQSRKRMEPDGDDFPSLDFDIDSPDHRQDQSKKRKHTDNYASLESPCSNTNPRGCLFFLRFFFGGRHFMNFVSSSFPFYLFAPPFWVLHLVWFMLQYACMPPFTLFVF